MDIEDMELALRQHLQGDFSSLTITFNDHAAEYIDAKEASRLGQFQYVDWTSDNEKEKAITGNRVWIVQWYPVTPVGFCKVGASSLKSCVDAMEKKLSIMTFI
jgi:hypothetical protein